MSRILVLLPLFLVALPKLPADGGAPAGPARPVTSAEAAPRARSLAWEAASGIANDEHDRLVSQARVLSAMIDAGELEQVESLVGNLEGWRRGIVLAALARALIDRADLARAGRLLPSIESALDATTPDWAAARVANAADDVRRRLGLPVEDREGNPHELPGEKAARKLAEARVLVEAGRAVEAVPVIREALLNFDLETAPDLVATLVTVATVPSAADLAPGLRADAVRVVRALPPERLAPVLAELTERLHPDVVAGFLDDIDRSLDEAAEAASSQAPHFAAEVLAGLASVAGSLGRDADAGRLLGEALEHARRGDPWERPSLLAKVVSAAADVRDARPLAAAIVEEGLAATDAVENPRPRSLALVDLLLAAARADVAGEPLLAAATPRVAAVAALHRSSPVAGRPVEFEVIRPTAP